MLFFILFGIRRRAQRLGTVLQLCSRCHASAAQSVIRVRTFFTLFFVPLIPLGSKYRATCTMCGSTVSIPKEQASQLVASVQARAVGLPAMSASPAVPAASVPHPNVPFAPPGIEWTHPEALPGSFSPLAGTTTADSTNHTSEMPIVGQSVPRVSPSPQPSCSQTPWWRYGMTVVVVALVLVVGILGYVVSQNSDSSIRGDSASRLVAPERPSSSASPSPNPSPSPAAADCTTKAASTLLSCSGQGDGGMRVATPEFTVRANATMLYTESSNCVSGSMLLSIFQTGVSSIPELSLFECNSLTHALTPGTYYIVISATGNWKLEVSAGSSSPITMLPAPNPSPTSSGIACSKSASTLLSCSGQPGEKRVATPQFTIAGNATMSYTESSNCISGMLWLGIVQLGVSSLPELSLSGCNTLTYHLTPGTYYVVISATGNWRLWVGAGSSSSSPTATSPSFPTTTQPTTNAEGGDCTTGYNNTKGIDPSVPVPTHLTATVFGDQTSTTREIRLLWQQPPGYAGWQVYESTPPGPFANASACATAGSPGVGFIIVNRHATYRFYVVAQSNVSSQTYSPPASVTLTVP
jgi:hypothetical protein